jgi:ABC-type antimicrobial peptide transport system permease subunit
MITRQQPGGGSRCARILKQTQRCVAGFTILLFLILVAIFAPIIAPYEPTSF